MCFTMNYGTTELYYACIDCMMSMEIFEPSMFLAIFPYLFIGSFPIFGLILVTKWIIDDVKKKRKFDLKI